MTINSMTINSKEKSAFIIFVVDDFHRLNFSLCIYVCVPVLNWSLHLSYNFIMKGTLGAPLNLPKYL